MKKYLSHKIFAILSIQILLLLPSAWAGENDGLQITINQFERKDDKLYISLFINMNNVPLSSQQRIEYTPIITTSTKEIALPPILLIGKKNRISYNRSITFARKKKDTEISPTTAPYSIVKGYRNRRKTVTYTYTQPYEAWMEGAKLQLNSILIGCDDNISSATKMLDSLKVEKAIIPIIVPILLTVETVSSENSFVRHLSTYEEDMKIIGTRKDKNVLKIYFHLNESNTDLTYMNNATELERLKDATNEIYDSEDSNIEKILIAGFSSIEGFYDYNTTLSLRRAQSIYNYMLENTKVDKSLIEIYNGAENWMGLREMVEESDMQYKDEVLNIIDTVPIFEGRELQLMHLDGGDTYRYMQKHFFAELRHAGYVKIYFEHKKDEVAEIINKAISYIDAKQYYEALELLQEIEHDQRTQTPIGVCYMMIGDFENAKIYLKKAADRGDETALKNLEQIYNQ